MKVAVIKVVGMRTMHRPTSVRFVMMSIALHMGAVTRTSSLIIMTISTIKRVVVEMLRGEDVRRTKMTRMDGGNNIVEMLLVLAIKTDERNVNIKLEKLEALEEWRKERVWGIPDLQGQVARSLVHSS